MSALRKNYLTEWSNSCIVIMEADMKKDQRKLKGEETKNRIIEATMTIISEGGLKAISANKIAERANISKSSIFHHYASIDEIPYEIVSTICSAMTGITGTDDIKDLETFFKLIGENTFNLKDENLMAYRTLFAFYNEALYSGKYQAQISQLKRDFIVYLKEAIEAINRKKISEELAEIIAIDLDGLGLHYLIEADSKKFMRLWQVKTQEYIRHIELMK